MIVTIDGPAGAGKSTVARLLAERLGFQFLDTGAMYRAVVWAALTEEIPMEETDRLRRLVERIDIDLAGDRVLLNGEDVSTAIRRPEVGQVIHHVADDPVIRARMVEKQRVLAAGTDVVTEGRDQGTVAFPDAPCKIFLTASAEERARRRFEQLGGKQGAADSLEQVLEQQNQRDHRDSVRPVGALLKAEDAIEVVTDGMSTNEVARHLEKLVRERQQ